MAAKLGRSLDEVYDAEDFAEWVALAILEGWSTLDLSVAGDTKGQQDPSQVLRDAYGVG